MRLWSLALVATTAFISSCSKDAANPMTPPLPGEVLDVYPSPWAEQIALDTEVWIRFSVPIDPKSLRNAVTLTLDGNVVAASLRLDEAGRRIVLRPSHPLSIARTYRVLHSGGLRTTEGGSIAAYRWFFKTTGVRIPTEPFPPNGAVESPFVRLAWSSHGDENIEYLLYWGTDSLTVENRITAPIAVTEPFLVPRGRWPVGTRVFWAVTMRNPASSELANGPVWWFDVPSSPPTRQVRLEMSDWGSVDAAGIQDCFGQRFKAGDGALKTAIRWDLSPLKNSRVLSASIDLTVVGISPTRLISIFEALTYWDACAVELNGDPSQGPLLVLGVTQGTQVTLSSEALAARVEAIARFSDQSGFVLTSYPETELVASNAALILDVYDAPALSGTMASSAQRRLHRGNK